VAFSPTNEIRARIDQACSETGASRRKKGEKIRSTEVLEVQYGTAVTRRDDRALSIIIYSITISY
jgi:hypothetical protein